MKEKNKRVVFWIISAVNIGVLLFGLVGMMMSPMLFDAPGASENMATQIIFWMIVLIPLVSLVSIVTSVVWYKSFFKRAFKVSLIPVLFTSITYLLFWLQDMIGSM